MDFTKLIDRIYGEQDFARNVATSIAGAVALVVYLSTSDWVVAAIAGVILFPVAKVLTQALVRIGSEKRSSKVLEQAAQRSFTRLSNDEKEVVFAFVDAGGTSLTWGRINRLGLNSSAIETLIQRDLMWTSVTADGMTETFAIDTGIRAQSRGAARNPGLHPLARICPGLCSPGLSGPLIARHYRPARRLVRPDQRGLARGPRGRPDPTARPRRQQPAERLAMGARNAVSRVIREARESPGTDRSIRNGAKRPTVLSIRYDPYSSRRG